MLLSEARTRVRRHVDDEDSVRFVDAEVDDALRSGQIEAHRLAYLSAPSLFAVEGSISTTSAGIADVSALAPARILNVAVSSGSQRLTVSPVRMDAAPTDAAGVQSLKITYVARVSFPTASGNPFVWGHANVNGDDIAALMCILAAGELLIKDGAVNQALESREAKLRASVASAAGIPGWTVLPLDSFSDPGAQSCFSYVMTAPDTLQLVL